MIKSGDGDHEVFMEITKMHGNKVVKILELNFPSKYSIDKDLDFKIHLHFCIELSWALSWELHVHARSGKSIPPTTLTPLTPTEFDPTFVTLALDCPER